jgi:DNA-binding NtrC family response regulator
MNGPRVLIIDDEPDMLENCRRLLERAGYRCNELADPLRAREHVRDTKPDALLLDLRMPGADGITVLAAVLADDPTLPVIIMTGHGSVASAVQAIREGAFDYLTKPFSADQLVVAVERAVRFRGLTLENRTLRERVGQPSDDGAIGSSPAMTRVLDQVRRVGPTDASVLITGESGVGKEIVARAVHRASQRTGPFVPLDCAALPEALLESELFGHERGAFTGAVARRDGLLVEARGGTVFLDEIGELPTGLQAKLLRALEERQVRRVGGSGLIPLDIRLVAATNVDLEAALQRGTFRQDLYFRLNVVQLVVPPLRERPDDLEALLRHFLDRFAHDLGKEAPQVSPDAWSALERYQWPGNVRELRNVAQRAAVLDEDGQITLADLPETLRGWAPGNTEPASLGAPPPYEDAREAAALAFRDGYLRRLLAHCGGNVSQAARLAGVSRRTLHRWLAETGVATDAGGHS